MWSWGTQCCIVVTPGLAWICSVIVTRAKMCIWTSLLLLDQLSQCTEVLICTVNNGTCTRFVWDSLWFGFLATGASSKAARISFCGIVCEDALIGYRSGGLCYGSLPFSSCLITAHSVISCSIAGSLRFVKQQRQVRSFSVSAHCAPPLPVCSVPERIGILSLSSLTVVLGVVVPESFPPTKRQESFPSRLPEDVKKSRPGRNLRCVNSITGISMIALRVRGLRHVYIIVKWGRVACIAVGFIRLVPLISGLKWSAVVIVVEVHCDLIWGVGVGVSRACRCIGNSFVISVLITRPVCLGWTKPETQRIQRWFSTNPLTGKHSHGQYVSINKSMSTWQDITSRNQGVRL